MAIFSKWDKYKDYGLLIIRIGLGVLFIYHGLPKLIGGPAKWEKIGSAASSVGLNFLPVFWGFMAAAIETFGGLLIIFGLAFKPVCILLVLELIVAAVFTYHLSGNFGDATHALEDAVTFLGLFFIGPGRYRIGKNKAIF